MDKKKKVAAEYKRLGFKNNRDIMELSQRFKQQYGQSNIAGRMITTSQPGDRGCHPDVKTSPGIIYLLIEISDMTKPLDPELPDVFEGIPVVKVKAGNVVATFLPDDDSA